LEREQTRHTFRKVKIVFGSIRQGLTRVETLTPTSNEWTVLTAKHDIEQACMNENQQRFTQASDTPSLLPSQLLELGWTANTPTATAILNNTLSAHGHKLHETILDLAPFLSTPHTINALGSISTEVSRSDFRSAWKKCREFTSSGKSGLHFGHFIASCNDDLLTDLDRKFLEISMTHGIILQRWTQAIDVMIPKKAESIQVTKLRTIMLFEPDWNLLNKIVVGRTKIQAELSQSIAPEQYGSRKNKSAILHATNKQVLFDIVRQQKSNAALMVLDAKSCYDRISIPIAALSLQRLGVTQPTIQVMFNTLSQMRHYIRTKFGDSDSFYQESSQKFHGIGQGNGAGPMIWVAVSSPLLMRLHAQGHGITIRSANTDFHFTSFTFVDDNDLIQTITDIIDTTSEAQASLDMWATDLRTSGGALAPDKCSWCSIVHQWEKDKWRLLSKADTPGDIYITTEQGQQAALRRQEATDSNLALGVKFSPSGKMSDHFLHLREKCRHWASKIPNSCLNRPDTFTALTTTIWKTLEYSLLATTLKKHQCDALASEILSKALPKSGICRNISRQSLFASTKYQGFGLRHPFFTQGCRKLTLFLLPTDPSSRFLIHTSHKLLELQCGLGPDFLRQSPKPFSNIVDSTWLTSLWEFLHSSNITLTKTKNDILLFTNDGYIMNQLCLQHRQKELQLLNHCRIYLQITNISDAITLDGMGFRNSIWKGTRLLMKQNQSQWPEQPNPSPQAWSLWRRALQATFDTNANGKFTHPMHITSLQPSPHWIWHYCESEQRLYQLHDSEYIIWHKHLPTRRRSRRPKFFSGKDSTSVLPTTAQLCTIYRQGSLAVLESIPPHQSSHTNSSLSPTCITSSILSHNHGDMGSLFNDIIKGDGLVVSDGSYKDGYATGGWIISSRNCFPQHRIEGSIISPGHSSDQDSHRAEASAMLGAIVSINKLLDHHKAKNIVLSIACDNQSVLNYSFDTDKFPELHANTPDFDILASIRSQKSPSITYKWRHVKGHQDNLNHPTTLDIWAKLNIEADRIAKTRCQLQRTNITKYSLPDEEWQVLLDEYKVCKRLTDTVYEFVSASTMKVYWQKRRNFTDSTFDSVDWNAIQTASKRTTRTRLHWLLKHTCGLCGVNAILCRCNLRSDDQCPRCHLQETAQHVWLCDSPGTRDIWAQSLTSLTRWLITIDTEPALITTIIHNLLPWSEKGTIRTPLEQQQDAIGWNIILEGTLPKAWSSHQNNHYKAIGSLQSGKRWLVQLILKLWDIAWDLWEHRNNIAHESNALIELQQLDCEIQSTLTMNEYPAEAAYLFSDHTREQLATATLPVKKSWLQNFHAHVQYANNALRSDTGLKSMRQTMRRFLHQD
jgi:Reverse transcriptase (RNA-dependent DNA polymerase)